MSTARISNPIDYASPNGPQDDVPRILGLTAGAWIKIAVVTVLMSALFRFNLSRLWLKTNPFFGEANWGHSMIVPLIGLYYLYVHRDQLLSAKISTAWEGLAILLGGVIVFVYGIWPGQNDYLKDLGMVVTLFGVVLMLCGWQVMKVAWFPILFLVCAIPWPGLVYSWIAGPLQELAARVAVMVLQLTGVDAGVGGTKIFIYKGASIPPRTLNVAEACAGLRSLMTFISIGTAIAFLSDRPLWAKLLIAASSVPIAIACNVMRVSGQGLLDHYWSEAWSESFAHQFAGLVMLIPAFFLILAVGWFVDRLVVEEVDEKTKRLGSQSLVVANSNGPVSTAAVRSVASAHAPVTAIMSSRTPRTAAAIPPPTPGASAANRTPARPAAAPAAPVLPRTAKPAATKISAPRTPMRIAPKSTPPANSRPTDSRPGNPPPSTKETP